MPTSGILMISGHRPDKVGGYGPSPTQDWIRERLRRYLSNGKVVFPAIKAMSGMALGVDQWFAEEAIVLGIPVIAVIPFEGQEARWPDPSQAHYRALLERCAEVQVVSTTPGVEAFHLRNKRMVDQAEAALVVWDGSAGGTAHTVSLLEKVKIPAWILDPHAKMLRKLERIT